MTSIAPLTELAGSIPGNFKIVPTGGYASSFQAGEGIEKAFDGDYSTIYHSSWSGAEAPITLRFDFNEADLDYLIYYPRSSGSNGRIKKLEIFYVVGDDSERVKLGDYDFGGSSSPAYVSFPTTLKKVKSIEFLVESGVTDSSGNLYASCSEMEFYQINPARESGSGLFADKLLTTLKPGITMADIDKVENPYFRELARTIYQGNYSLDFRVGEYYPYMNRSEFSAKYSVSAYNLYENPTGIYFSKGKHVIIVDDLEEGQSISLAIPNYTGGSSASGDWGLKSKSYPLQNGVNVIEVTDWDGIGYISYFTADWEAAGSVKVHIPRGIVQGYFDVSKHSNEDFVKLLENANAYPFFDLVGERTHLAYTVSAYRSYTKGKAVELLAKYDEMVLYQQRYLGWEKYLTLPKNRVHCRANQSYFMYKDDSGASFEHATMSYIANPDQFYLQNWGPCHEVGHIHQFKFNNWAGMGEVSVNFPNRYFGYYVIDPTFNDPKNEFDAAYAKVVGAKIPLLTTPGLFDRLAPFSQLFYYFIEKGNEDFFPDLNQALRNTEDDTNGWGPAQYEMNFAKKACEVTQLNLIPFFEKWGMLYYTDQDGRAPFNVSDYSSGVYQLTKAKVDELKEYIRTQGYPEPDEDVSLVKPGGRRITP